MIGRPFLYLQWRGALTGQMWIFTDETLFIQESTVAVVAGRLEEAIVQHILQILTQSTQQTLFSHPHRGTGVKPHTLLLKKSKGTSVRVQFGSSIRYCTSIINIITVKCGPFLLFVKLLSQLVKHTRGNWQTQNTKTSWWKKKTTNLTTTLRWDSKDRTIQDRVKWLTNNSEPK